jgi:3-oxoacyl-[acyl-carrier-protein] synthase II
METSTRIVITGIGLANGLGIGVEAFWNNALKEDSGLAIKKDWEQEGISDQYFGSCNFDFKAHFQNMGLPAPLRYSQLALLGCKLALEDAGLSKEMITPDRTGLVVNTSFGANAAVESYMQKLIEKGPARVSPVIFTRTVTNCALGDVARYYNLKGPSSILLGENSICYGIDLVQNNKADVMICGGFDEVRNLIVKTYAEHDMLLEPDNTQLKERQFTEQEKNKLVLGEGTAYIIIEKLEHALQRGARIYAEILGYATGADGRCGQSIGERSSEDLQHVMNNAIKATGVGSESVDLVVGSSCLPGQIKEYEMKAIHEVISNGHVHYTNLKSRLGETFGSSDLTALATGALSLKYDIVPGTGWPADSFEEDGIEVPEQHVASSKNIALINSLHIGGNTTSVVLQKYVA